MRNVEKMVLLESLKPGLILDIDADRRAIIIPGEKRISGSGCGYIQGNAGKSERKCKEGKLKDNLSFVIASAEALPFAIIVLIV